MGLPYVQDTYIFGDTLVYKWRDSILTGKNEAVQIDWKAVKNQGFRHMGTGDVPSIWPRGTVPPPSLNFHGCPMGIAHAALMEAQRHALSYDYLS